MKRAYFISLIVFLASSLFPQSNPVSLIDLSARAVSAITTSPARPQAQARILDQYGELPLSFKANQGQTDPQVKFLSRGAGYSLFLTSDEAVLTFRPSIPSPAKSWRAREGHQPPLAHQPSADAVLRIKLLNTNPNREVSGQDELPGKCNYFIGNDPKKWHTNVRQFSKVRYENVYPGVDLVYYGHQRELEYDFVLQPGANPQAIRLEIAGAKRVRLEHGDLVLTSAGGDVHLRSPHVYQEAKGRRREVRGRYVFKSRNEVGFRVEAYDQRRVLVIDPVLAYSTYLGGSKGEHAASIAVDSAGNAYVTGTTFSTNFPTANAFQPTYRGGGDAFVTKMNADGTALIYSSYLGGSNNPNTNAEDDGYGIAVDTAGSAYVMGETLSSDFPTVNALFPNSCSLSGSAFVTKINASGNALVYSTCLAGFTHAGGVNGIAVDSGGNAYLTGYTYGYLPTVNAIQPVYGGTVDAFVMKINASGSAIVYSTYLGGSGSDGGTAIAVDSAGNAYVIGGTGSKFEDGATDDFPTVNAIQPVWGGGVADAFVAKINASGTAFVYSTYLGGSSEDSGLGIAADSEGNAYVTGVTESDDFPTANAIQPVFGGHVADAFVAKINPDGSAFVYSTYLSGSSLDAVGSGIVADTNGNAYVTGSVDGSGFPTMNAIQAMFGGGSSNAFVTEFNADGSALLYSTYLGGKSKAFGAGDSGASIAVDGAGSAYVTGEAQSANFPKSALAFQSVRKGTSDAFITKIAAQTLVSLSSSKLRFSTQVIGTTSATKKVTVANLGSGNLTMNKIYITGPAPGDFAETDTCGATLASSASCTISVTFTPTAKNARNAALAISDSDPASPQAVALSGTGTSVSLSAKSQSFANVPVGTTSSPKTVILTNVGSSQLNFIGISVTGANPGDFSATNTCGTGIGAGLQCTITVKFTPTATGTRKAAVSISDDGGGSPQKIALTGTGI